MKLYTVFDKTAQARTGSIIAANIDAPAVRLFHDALAQPQSPWASHPADYNLMAIGTIADSGLVVGFPEPEVIATGAAWAEQQQRVPAE